jgi:ABC-type multidrug transport system ATPase subunit
MPPAEPALAVEGVARRFGHRSVLSDISFDVSPGETLILMGQNGAGKTTLLRVIAGLLRPSAGAVRRLGTVGMVSHHSMMYDALSARENLAFFARLYGLEPGKRLEETLERVGLGRAMDQRVGTFSRGMVQRLAIARALLPEPAIVLLDEPLSGLDDAGARLLGGLLGEWAAGGRAVVVASHQLAQLVPVATRVGFLVRGRLAALEPLAGRSGDDVLRRYRELVADER